MNPAHNVLADAVAPQPWRNGGGVTRELLAWPSGDHWQVRLSLADIASDGPFSRYEGVQRWFAVLTGGGVQLTIAGQPVRALPGDEPLCFDGATTVDCGLVAGPTRDVNLMLRGRSGALVTARPGVSWTPPADAALTGLLTAVPGRCQGKELPAQALCWWTDPSNLTPLRFDPAATGPGPTGWWWWAGSNQDAAA